MRSSSELERAAMMSVARHFRATLEHGADPRDAYLIIAGKRVAVEVTAPEAGRLHRSRPQAPRLRFDRVVVRLLGRLRVALAARVPRGTTAVVTVTAPIRLAARTAAALEEMIGTLPRASARRPLRKTINGNQVRIQIMRSGSTSKAPLAGFVHNPDTPTSTLFDLTRALLRVGARSNTRKGFSGARWLVIVTEHERAWIPTYRHACSELFARADFQRIVLVSAAGEISTLAA